MSLKCKKCESSGTILLRKKDYYCENCFFTNTSHKFRACIGKTKILSANEKVLICLSGGKGSTVLLDLIYSAISKDDHKKLRIIPLFVHIIGFDEESINISRSIQKQCSNYNFDVKFCQISDYYSNEVALQKDANIKESQDFKKKVDSLSQSTKIDFLLNIKRILYIRIAKQLTCNTIFTAETTSTLATNLLSNLAIGRGSQVENDIGFKDSRDDTVKILRPMKDISQDELNTYIKLKELLVPVLSIVDVKERSLQSIIASFVDDLQQNYQATISTVCKTADKIGLEEKKLVKKCKLCENFCIQTPNKLSALEATNISQLVSLEKPMSDEASTNLFEVLDNRVEKTISPFNNQLLCYSCSRSYSETNAFELFYLESSSVK